jgi:hypothetical protein
MFPTPGNRRTFVVTCKRCRRDVPTGVREFPFQSVAVECPLCGELGRYLPSEVFLGLTNSSAVSSGPEACSVRPRRSHAPINRGMVYLGECLTAGIWLAREKQVNLRAAA